MDGIRVGVNLYSSIILIYKKIKIFFKNIKSNLSKLVVDEFDYY
jgi:hypothetical protein